MSQGDSYFDCKNSGIGSDSLLKLITIKDAKGNPFFKTNMSVYKPPKPPYLEAATTFFELNIISGINYMDGSGPSNASFPFTALADGVIPQSGVFTFTPTTNIQFSKDNGFTWHQTPVTLAYTNGFMNTGFVLLVRLKSGLPIGSYTENLTISAPIGSNVANHVIIIHASVTAGIYIIATGGLVTQVGDYKVHKFLINDVFSVTQISNISSFNDVKSLIVGGGGGGGGVIYTNANAGGGAGGGQVLSHTLNLTVQSYPILVGDGGLGSPDNGTGTNGSDSSFDNVIAIGGGYGGSKNTPGNTGGNGGGSNWSGTGIAVSGGLGLQFNGGSSSANLFNCYGSGGGAGASQNGFAADNFTPSGGKGGDGITSSITGIATYYGGGGAGGTGIYSGNTVLVLGGKGGGGNSYYSVASYLPGLPGTDGLGGGGGGASYEGDGGNGGKGVVIISYYSPM